MKFLLYGHKELLSFMLCSMIQLSEQFYEIGKADMYTVEALKLLIPLQYEFFLKFNSLIFTYFQKCKKGAISLENLDDIRQLVT
jgi:hypothetical protein